MASHGLADGKLNQPASSPSPENRAEPDQRPELTTIPNGFIIVNAEILGWYKAAQIPLSNTAIIWAAQSLLAGFTIDGRILQLGELRDIYGIYAKNPWRRFDLSRPLQLVFQSRCFAYLPWFAPIAIAQPQQPCNLVATLDFIHHLNDLVKRILHAEYTGVFAIRPSPSEPQDIRLQAPAMPSELRFFGSYLDQYYEDKIGFLEREVSQCLSDLNKTETESGN
ncbi:hypothetical protein F5Y13DRAFT_195443 [Hypoxylon sp. FL1857]|nr:hypothetical protein F5Y13DRAFT_195443 [Hypoxylon sp. FL1857]